jgi:hypothetical protein
MREIHSSENLVFTFKTKGLHISKYPKLYTVSSSLKGHNMMTCEKAELYCHPFASSAPEGGG